MNGFDKMIEFKQKAKSFYLSEDLHDSKDVTEMKEAINYIVLWLCELEEKEEFEE